MIAGSKPPFRFRPGDIPPGARPTVAKALADHLGAPVDLGETHAEPEEAPEETAEEEAEEAPAQARVRPWARGLAAVAVAGALAAGGWGWLNRPTAGLPQGYGLLVTSSATAPSPTAPGGSSDAINGGGPIKQAATAPAQAPPAQHAPAQAGTGTAPAQVLAPPPPAGATVCTVRQGIMTDCHWVAAR